METIWFIFVAILFVGYIVLDGFDLGVGSIYLLVAKTEAERDQVRSSIGPIWDGNEVWLIAAGGTLFFAFPKAYAAAFSGFYLALFLILWLLILRGLAIELRSQLKNPLWHTFWDAIFSFASTLLIFLFGIALGNLLRGIPLFANSDPTFANSDPTLANSDPTLAFWTDFLPGTNAGLLDWYTLLVGGLALIVLVIHGSEYLALKTEGDLKMRAKRLATRGVFILIPFTIMVFGVTPWIQPAIIEHYYSQPWGIVFPLSVILALTSLGYYTWRGSTNKIFIASSSLIVAMLATAVFGLFPRLLLNSLNPSNSLTIYNSVTSSYGLRVGLIWFSAGFLLLVAYVVVMYRSFWGKATSSSLDEY